MAAGSAESEHLNTAMSDTCKHGTPLTKPCFDCDDHPVPMTETGASGFNFDHMTDAWVDGGQYCAQDVLDLRNEVRRLREIIGDVRLALENERDSFPILWKHSARLQAALRKCQNTNSTNG